jgi:uncharacterized membrane protein
MRVLRHLLSNRWTLTRRFPAPTLDAIEGAVAASETHHRGEVRFAIEAALDLSTLWRDQTPRDRALEVFAELGVWDTKEKNGVLIYVLLAERDVEIVADRGLDDRVTAEEWEAVCAAIEQDFRAGRWREGALEGVAGVTQLLAREFPSDGANANEQPNRPHIL